MTGTPVTFAPHCKVVGGQGYRKIGVKTTSEENTDWVHLPFESVGLIVEHKFGIAEYVDHIDVVAGRLKTNVHMWYLVAFRELLWVRYDWLTKWSAQ